MVEIKGYRIERVIGQGGMATVYLAVQETLGRHIALKVMNPDFASEPALTQRFLEEGPITARLNDPQIVTVYDTGVDNGHYYLAMEFLPGGTLKQQIRQGMTLERSLNIAEQLGRGLAYAHSRHVVHRDIKPHNILFRESGEPVITDFGIAKAGVGASQLTMPGTTFGSPNYMSPEQAKGLPLDSRSDLYSLGIILYEMLTGELPYRAADSFTLAQLHVSAPLPRLPESLAPLQPVLDKLLAKDPDQRYTIAEQFVEDLRTACQQLHTDLQVIPEPRSEQPEASDATRPLPPHAPSPASASTTKPVPDPTPTPAPPNKPAPPPPAAPPAPRSRWPLAVAGVAVLAIAVGAYLYLQPPPEEPRLAQAPEPAPVAPPPPVSEPPVAVVTEPTPPPVEEPPEVAVTEPPVEPVVAVPTEPPIETVEPEPVAPPVSVDSYLAEARALFEAGQLDASLDVLDQGISDLGDDNQLLALRAEVMARQSLLQARSLQNRGDLQGAMDRVEQGLTQAPEDSELLALQRNLRTTLEERHRLDQASAHMARARDLLQTGQPDAAQTEVDLGLRLLPEDRGLLTLNERIRTSRIDRLYEQAYQSYQEDDLTASETLIMQGLALAPQHREFIDLQNTLAEERQQRQLEAALRQREAELAEVRELIAAGQLEAGAVMIEDALGRYPEDAELLALRAELDAALTEPEPETEPDLDRIGEELAELVDRFGLSQIQRFLQEQRAVQAGAADSEATTDETSRPPIETEEPEAETVDVAAADISDDSLPAVDVAPDTEVPDAEDIVGDAETDQTVAETAPTEEPDEPADEQPEIERLLAEADTFMTELKLTTPRGGNAYENYQTVLRLDPDNTAARRGIDTIIGRYLQWARSQRDRGDFERSLSNIDRGLSVQANHRELLQLREDVLARQEAARRPAVVAEPAPAAPPPDPCAIDRSSRECWCQSFRMFCD